jgi:two-component system sensor histidine kinase KdpD
VLVVGGRLDAEGAELLAVVAAQVVLVLDRKRLEAASAEGRALREVDDLRSALLAAVSHDLRTPLASIKAAATALLSATATFSPAQRDELLATIDAEADRLDLLVEDLLDMSRIHQGTVELVRQNVDLVDVVRAAVADALRAVGGAPGTAQVTGVETLIVATDPGLVARVVYNLVLNALRHGGGSSVTVDVGSAAGSATIRVIDAGPGIPQAERARVVRAFQRRGDVGEDAAEGIGLGLAIANGFAEALGGSLEIDDTPGGGCTMIFAVPDARDDVGRGSAAS